MAKLITPVISTESDSDYRKVIRHVAAKGRGADVIFALGTTGEFYIFSTQEKKDLIAIASDEVQSINRTFGRRQDNGLKIAVGVTGGNLDKSIELAQYAEGLGADYAVFMPIYVAGRKGQFSRRIGEGLRTLIGETNKISFVLYNHPGMTGGKNIRTKTWKEFSKSSRIVALKDSSGDNRRFKNYMLAAGDHAEVYSGDEVNGLVNLGQGVVAGSSNVLPLPWNMAVKREDGEDIFAGRVADELLRFQRVYTQNPIGAFHYILNRKGVISSPKVFDPSLKVKESLARDLDCLMGDRNFNLMFESSS